MKIRELLESVDTNKAVSGKANAPFGTMGGGIRPPSSGSPTQGYGIRPPSNTASSAPTQGYGIRPPSNTTSSAPVADESDWMAPHGNESQEFEMFKEGSKPAVIVRGNAIKWYNGLLNTRQYPWKIFTSQGHDSYVIGQPGENERVDTIYRLVSRASQQAEQGDFSAYNNSNYHRLLGNLLGYPKDKIEQFIAHYFRDREDLAQQHFQMETKNVHKKNLKK